VEKVTILTKDGLKQAIYAKTGVAMLP